ncbi:unnamed protein product [Polarella glacialis]|uniref:Cytochrome P450 n=1 Tax=Polarella glacialis TaxID=89957 RepID=A0A813DDT6_POLGL|nr:unnamed protein product [Polarella glacialis]
MRSVLLQEAFAAPAVARSKGVVEEEAAKLCARLVDSAGSPVEVRPMLRKAFTSLFFRWALSLDPDSGVAQRLATLFEGAWSTLTDPVVTASDFVGLPGVTGTLPKIKRERTRLFRELITARRRSESNRAGETDFLDAMLKSQKKHGFGEDLIVETLVSLTTAGISTVATSLEWLLLLFAKHQSAQTQARSEILGQGEQRYLEACILETLRLKTPLFVPRMCLEDLEVSGWGLKEGTLLLPDSYKLAHDQAHWGGGPVDEFRPERFLNAERPLLDALPGLRPKCPFTGASRADAGAAEATPEKGATAFKFLPFGVGARFCPGAPLALSELHIFAAALLRAFDWQVDGGQVDLSEAYSFTLTPLNPSRLIFRPRR